jgi:hypothetical protein
MVSRVAAYAPFKHIASAKYPPISRMFRACPLNTKLVLALREQAFQHHVAGSAEQVRTDRALFNGALGGCHLRETRPVLVILQAHRSAIDHWFSSFRPYEKEVN